MAIPGGDNPLFLNLTAEQIIALCAYGEARNQGDQGMQAVISVIVNRATVPSKYATGPGSTVWHRVVLAPKQFSIFNSDEPGYNVMTRIAGNFNSEVASNRELQIAYNLAQLATQGLLEDNTFGATNYLTKGLYLSGTVSWADPAKVIGAIGDHVFLALAPIGEKIKSQVSIVTKSIATFIEENQTTTILIVMLMSGAIGYYYIKKKRRRKT